MLYFAYGSNLDRSQMLRRCPSAKRAGIAVLKNHALGFTGFSYTRGGAVATVVPRVGWEAQGLLYSLSTDDLGALDVCEGFPFVYNRVTRIVTLADGKRVRAQVYVHRERRARPPAPEYLKVIQRAYRSLGFDSQPLAAAAWGLT